MYEPQYRYPCDIDVSDLMGGMEQMDSLNGGSGNQQNKCCCDCDHRLPKISAMVAPNLIPDYGPLPGKQQNKRKSKSSRGSVSVDTKNGSKQNEKRKQCCPLPMEVYSDKNESQDNGEYGPDKKEEEQKVDGVYSEAALCSCGANTDKQLLQDSCADFLSIMHDTVLETVQECIKTTLRDFFLHTLDKLECLNSQMVRNEGLLSKMYLDIMDKMTHQHDKNRQKFKCMHLVLEEILCCLSQLNKSEEGANNTDDDQTSIPESISPTASQRESAANTSRSVRMSELTPSAAAIGMAMAASRKTDSKIMISKRKFDTRSSSAPSRKSDTLAEMRRYDKRESSYVSGRKTDTKLPSSSSRQTESTFSKRRSVKPAPSTHASVQRNGSGRTQSAASVPVPRYDTGPAPRATLIPETATEPRVSVKMGWMDPRASTKSDSWDDPRTTLKSDTGTDQRVSLKMDWMNPRVSTKNDNWDDPRSTLRTEATTDVRASLRSDGKSDQRSSRRTDSWVDPRASRRSSNWADQRVTRRSDVFGRASLGANAGRKSDAMGRASLGTNGRVGVRNENGSDARPGLRTDTGTDARVIPRTDTGTDYRVSIGNDPMGDSGAESRNCPTNDPRANLPQLTQDYPCAGCVYCLRVQPTQTDIKNRGNGRCSAGNHTAPPPVKMSELRKENERHSVGEQMRELKRLSCQGPSSKRNQKCSPNSKSKLNVIVPKSKGAGMAQRKSR